MAAGSVKNGAPRARNVPRGHLRRYRAGSRLARALLGPPAPRRAASPHQRAKVTILLMHAWGMGGTIRTTFNVAEYLAQRHDVEIVSVVRLKDEPFFEFPAGVTVTALDDRRPGRSPWYAGALRAFGSVLLHPADLGSNECSLWTDVRLLRKLRATRTGVLMGTRPSLNLLVAQAAGGGAAVIAAEHMNFRSHDPLLQSGIRRLYPALDALVVLTERDRLSYAKVLDGATPVVAIPNAARELPGGPSPLDRPVVLTAGRLRRQKGYDRLVRAWALVAEGHPEWRLRICGSGPKAPNLERQVARLGLEGKVELPGAVSHIEREMEQASIFALSSRYEGLPMVMLEAMSKGLPIVSFDCPTGPRDVLDDGVDGVLVRNGDVRGLARAIVELIEDEDERRRLGDAAIEKARTYGMDVVGGRWDALIAQLVQGEVVAPPPAPDDDASPAGVAAV